MSSWFKAILGIEIAWFIRYCGDALMEIHWNSIYHYICHLSYIYILGPHLLYIYSFWGHLSYIYCVSAAPSMLERPVSRLNCRESRVDRNCPVFEHERMRFQSRVTKSFGSLSFRCKVDVKACRCCDISATTILFCVRISLTWAINRPKILWTDDW